SGARVAESHVTLRCGFRPQGCSLRTDALEVPSWLPNALGRSVGAALGRVWSHADRLPTRRFRAAVTRSGSQLHIALHPVGEAAQSPAADDRHYFFALPPGFLALSWSSRIVSSPFVVVQVRRKEGAHSRNPASWF